MTFHQDAETGNDRSRRADRYTVIDLLITIIRENPKATREECRREYMRLIETDGYEDYRHDAEDIAFRLRFNAAQRSANPMTRQQIIRRAAERKKHEQERKAREDKAERKETDAAKRKITSNLLDLIMPNGKPLRDCTGAECVKFGSFYERIGKQIGPNKVVGKVLTEDDLQKLLAAKS